VTPDEAGDFLARHILQQNQEGIEFHRKVKWSPLTDMNQALELFNKMSDDGWRGFFSIIGRDWAEVEMDCGDFGGPPRRQIGEVSSDMWPVFSDNETREPGPGFIAPLPWKLCQVMAVWYGINENDFPKYKKEYKKEEKK